MRRLKDIVREARKGESARIPTHKLEPKHIANARLLTDREAMLMLLPRNSVVAELGVDEGSFSQRILEICEPAKLHLVDAWRTERYNDTKKLSVHKRFEKEISEGVVEIEIGLSTEVGTSFQNGYFDWVYIDTDHSYPTTLAELELYQSKVKPGGILAGHDYIIGNWDGLVRYGVQEAVYEFCVKHNWEILYVTSEVHDHPSFAIRQIQERD